MQESFAAKAPKVVGVNPKENAPPPDADQPRELQFFPAFLSFLIPGLGQIYQGRVAKGVLFLVCIYALFFYGMFLGRGTVQARELPRTYYVDGSVYLPHSAEENPPPIRLPPLLGDLYNRPQYLGQFWVGVAAWPALWQYFVYDKKEVNGPPLLGQFQRTPSNEDRNAVENFGDKRIDLGWVYTVIAGVLNIMVIYDALAGPAFLAAKRASVPQPSV